MGRGSGVEISKDVFALEFRDQIALIDVSANHGLTFRGQPVPKGYLIFAAR
jgi:hypothetical protein